jgi:hypothetical protein
MKPKKQTYNLEKSNFSAQKDYKSFKFGGFLQSISPILSMIPGAGVPLSLAAAGIGKTIEMNDAEKPKTFIPRKMQLGGLTNPSAQERLKSYQLGGVIKNYKGPKHKDGGIKVDAAGNQDSNSNLEVEGGEAKVMNSDQTYIFSDILGIADQANKLYKKYGKSESPLTKKFYNKSMAGLKSVNEGMRQQAESQEFAEGGPLKNMSPNILPSIVPGYVQPMQSIPSNRYPSRTGLAMDAVFSETSSPLWMQMPKIQGLPATPQVAAISAPAKKEFNLNTASAIMKGAGLVQSAVDALAKPEQEKLQLTNYKPGDSLYKDLATSFDPLKEALNFQTQSSLSNINNTAMSVSQRNAMTNNIAINAGRQAGQLGLQERQYNNQLKMQTAQREDAKAIDNRNETIRQQVTQSQNDAVARLADREFFNKLSQAGSTLNQIQYLNDVAKNNNENLTKQIQFASEILKGKYSDITLAPDFVQKVMSGDFNITDLLQFLKAADPKTKTP